MRAEADLIVSPPVKLRFGEQSRDDRRDLPRSFLVQIGLSLMALRVRWSETQTSNKCTRITKAERPAEELVPENSVVFEESRRGADKKSYQQNHKPGCVSYSPASGI